MGTEPDVYKTERDYPDSEIRDWLCGGESEFAAEI